MKLILLSSLLVFVSIHAYAAEPLRLLAGGPAAVKKFETVKAEAEKVTGTKIESNVTPFDLAFKALSTGQVDGMFSPPLPAAMAGAEKRGMPKQNPDDYQVLQLFQNKLYAVIHPNNPVTQLSREQLTGILSGKIKNWKEVGGNDEPLSVIMPKNYIASNRSILMFYLKADSSPAVEFVATQDGLLRGLQKFPNQIGFVTTTDSEPGFKPKFLLTEARNELYFIVKKKSRPEAQKLYEFISNNLKAFND